MADAAPDAFTASEVIASGISMVAITSIFAIARVVTHVIAPRRITIEDGIVMLAYVCNLSLCAMYISLTPRAAKIASVERGKMEPYPTLLEDLTFIARRYFMALLMFWVILWLIKLAILLLYRRLLQGIPKVYTWVWWGIVVVCAVTFPINFALYLTMCSSGLRDFFNGTCKDYTATEQLISLAYSYGADTVTNIMIMALPIRLTWYLQMQRSKKIGVVAIFATGLLCIIIATVRVAQIWQNTSKNNGPMDGSWLAIWGMAESSCAVIVGFIPASSALIRIAVGNKSSDSTAYSSRGYQKQPASQSTNRLENFELGLISGTAVPVSQKGMGSVETNSVCDDDTSSQKELAPVAKCEGILVTTTLQQSYEGSGSSR